MGVLSDVVKKVAVGWIHSITLTILAFNSFKWMFKPEVKKNVGLFKKKNKCSFKFDIFQVFLFGNEWKQAWDL